MYHQTAGRYFGAPRLCRDWRRRSRFGLPSLLGLLGSRIRLCNDVQRRPLVARSPQPNNSAEHPAHRQSHSDHFNDQQRRPPITKTELAGLHFGRDGPKGWEACFQEIGSAGQLILYWSQGGRETLIVFFDLGQGSAERIHGAFSGVVQSWRKVDDQVPGPIHVEFSALDQPSDFDSSKERLTIYMTLLHGKCARQHLLQIFPIYAGVATHEGTAILRLQNW